MDISGRHIVLGVTGSIAAYKIASLASLLVKQHADVTVIMTKNATNFINPITFETLTSHKCLVDTFDRNFQYSVEHVALAKQTEVFLVAPATANVMAKAAYGLADDMLTTTLLACTCPKIFAPAMNTRMYKNPVTQHNIEVLKSFGMEVIDPASGYLACGDTGEGKMPEVDVLAEFIYKALQKKDMEGLKVLVTAGPTKEKIDPVRVLTNHSTGKMGYAVARAASLRGADVTLVSGPVALKQPEFVKKIDVVSAEDMYEAVTSISKEQDIIIKAAAVADYRPVSAADEKLKKKDGEMYIELERTKDILAQLGKDKQPGQILCGFSMETENMIENSRAKLAKKNLDLVAANNLKQEGAGFAGNTNIITMIGKDGETELPLMSKDDAADKLLDKIMELRNK